jgi:tRNA pseudouridine13 synthase
MSATEQLAYALGRPEASGVIRSQPEDFQVDEELGFELTGDGEHVCLHIRKRNSNTAFVAKQIARLAGVKNMDVSYAGLKDRNAVTTQWFSVYLSNKPEPDWTQLNNDEIELLQVRRHNRKLRRGALKGNLFSLIVRQLDADSDELERRLQSVKANGVPNYFGEQRFGRDNLEQASRMFSGEIKVKNRDKRSIYLSAARSAMFNAVLSKRVENGSWNQALTGDVMMLDGSHSVFHAETIDDEIKRRILEQDIHPTGPLWGRGELTTSADVLMLEQQITQQFSVWCKGLEQAGLKQERRALRLPITGLEWTIEPQQLALSFFLPAGCYATTVLRELISTEAPSS